jgi:SAM-dependent methyltransferase
MRRREWFEKFFDDFYARVLGGQFVSASTLRQARLVKGLLGLRKGQRVLDCPCGLGRLTIPLARMGLAMTAADLQTSYADRVRRRASKERLSVDVACCDMRQLPFRREFDAVVNWFGSFGYFDDAGNLAAAKAAFDALKPGGEFLVDGINKSWVLSHFRPRGEQTVNGVLVVHRVRWNARTNRTEGTWTFSRGAQKRHRNISMRLFNGGELRALLRAAGFADVRFFGYETLARPPRLPLGPLTRHSRRFLAIAVKPLSPQTQKHR